MPTTAVKAELHIRTVRKGPRTILLNALCTAPLKLTDITESRNDRLLTLMVMSSSPGILDGDHYCINVEVGEQCCLDLQTQSYQRLFTTKGGASQCMEVNIHRGGSFCYLPFSVVPHAGSFYTGTNKIFLSEESELIWGDVLTCGRKLNGEIFQYSRFHIITEIYVEGKLTVRDNLFLQPDMPGFSGLAHMEGFTHHATFIYLNAKAPVGIIMEEITKYLSSQAEITFGISAASRTGFVVRLLGYKAEVLYDSIKMCSTYAKRI